MDKGSLVLCTSGLEKKVLAFIKVLLLIKKKLYLRSEDRTHRLPSIFSQESAKPYKYQKSIHIGNPLRLN